MLRLGEALGALTMGHVVFAGAGIINAAATPPRSPPPLASAPLASTAVAKVVTAMYSGAGIDGAALSDDAIFTDPAASCVGRAEVVEAFRALGASCSPEHVAPPLAVSQRTVSTASGPAAGAEQLESEFFLHQRYFKGAYYSGLVVRSTLVVRTDNAGRICAVEERWNGAPPLQFSAFRFARRVNGMLSAMLTPYVSRTS
jgi:hypothetical protein